MREHVRRHWIGYLVALGATAAAVAVRLALWGVLGEYSPFLWLVLAVVVAAWYGGAEAGLLATGLAAVAGGYFFTAPPHDLFLTDRAFRTSVLSFMVVGVLVTVLCQGLHAARRRREEEHEQLRREVRQRRAVEERLRQEERELRRSEGRFRSLIAATTSIIWTTDEAARFVVEQPSWSAYTGQTPDEYRELGWLDAVHAEDRERVRRCWEEARRTRERYECEGRLWHAATGAYRHFEARGVPMLAPDGSVQEWVGKCLDVEDRVRAEAALRESEERFRFLAETIPSMVWTAAADGTITYANPRWLEYCGITPEENARGWPELVLHADDYPRCMQQWSQALLDGRPYEIEVRNRRHDGVYRWFVTRAVPLKDAHGRVLCWFGVTTDIHEQKEMQEQLREADRRKDEFLATLSHELRNPLAPIRNSLEFLRMRGSLEAEEMKARDIIDRQARQLSRLVDDLLELSRITRGELQLRRERVVLASAIRDAVEAVQPQVEACAHQLALALPDEPIHLEADPTRLTQIVWNLLDNAVKYTDEGGVIRLEVRRQDGEAVLSVRDSGIGISPDHLPHVFEMFSQAAPALERAGGGLGIGLALVRGLVELHGGRIEARSDGPGRGSEFIVRLPIAGAPPPAGSAPGQTLRRTARRRILIVDDNRDSAESLGMMLELTGHEVHIAFSGAEALVEGAAFQPEVVLLDIGLPEMNGYETARRMRREPWGKDRVIIAVTGWGQEEDKRRAREAGFDHHLTKPVNPADLERLLGAVPAPEPP